MAGGGYYPTMMDCEWRNAPWNEPDIEYEQCLFCNGDGGEWYDEDENTYTEAEYKLLSKEKQEELMFEICEHCSGEGYVQCEHYQD